MSCKNAHLLTTSKHTCICILGARYTSTPASPTVHFYFFSELGAGRVEGGKEGRRRKKSYFMISKNYIINMVDFRQMHSHYAGPVTPGRWCWHDLFGLRTLRYPQWRLHCHDSPGNTQEQPNNGWLAISSHTNIIYDNIVLCHPMFPPSPKPDMTVMADHISQHGSQLQRLLGWFSPKHLSYSFQNFPCCLRIRDNNLVVPQYHLCTYLNICELREYGPLYITSLCVRYLQASSMLIFWKGERNIGAQQT